MSSSRPRTEEYKNWQMGVFRRDGFKCQMVGCGRKGKIHAHHIKRWADCPTLRFVITNGITLCYHCHEKVKDHETEYEAQFMSIVASKSDDAISILVALRARRKKDAS